MGSFLGTKITCGVFLHCGVNPTMQFFLSFNIGINDQWLCFRSDLKNPTTTLDTPEFTPLVWPLDILDTLTDSYCTHAPSSGQCQVCPRL